MAKAQHSENEDHGIWSHYFMGNRWETVETVSDFIFLGSKITADGDCSHEIKRCLLVGRKVMTNLDNIFKSRRLLRVPWTARRSNQSILKEISPGISEEGMMLKLKLQDFGHLM